MTQTYSFIVDYKDPCGADQHRAFQIVDQEGIRIAPDATLHLLNMAIPFLDQLLGSGCNVRSMGYVDGCHTMAELDAIMESPTATRALVRPIFVSASLVDEVRKMLK